ncbi:MAG: Holliday junction resolvase RuvX [Armatimonadota bacterium]|nr:Holliday junction resolvase RuvX [Armatimonadota bacterium]
MRVLGVDYGLRRIGLAIGETEIRMAFARTTLPGTGSAAADAAAIYSFFAAEECDMVVLGLPRLDDGHEGDQAAVTRAVGEALVGLGAPVEYFDERYSTAAARSSLSHLSGARLKEVLDSEAARIILEAYLQS